MPGVSKEQIEQAREVGLLSYLSEKEPNELIPSGVGKFRTATHSSLVVSKDRWYWNKGGFGGYSALDYLVKVRGMEFVAAVEAVLGARATIPFSALPVESAKVPQSKEGFAFYPPKPVSYSNLAVSYLQRRGISPEVINQALRAGIFFESRYFNPHNEFHNAPVCVFAGKNEAGKVVFAALRGIDSDLKIDKAGSDKRFGFCIPSKVPQSNNLAVFESPIDALSHATLQQRSGLQWDGYRLSLGGTTSVALTAFLERNPQIGRVMLHLDNDEAGHKAARRIKSELAEDSRFKHIRVSSKPPSNGKDYNEALFNTIKQEQKHNRREADIFI
jgi:hypothetical protein